MGFTRRVFNSAIPSWALSKLAIAGEHANRLHAQVGPGHRDPSCRGGPARLPPARARFHARHRDIINGEGGPDAEFIDKSLARVFALHTIDPQRIAMAGFSDGASASLSLGLANGDLFSAVFGFSPGFGVDLAHIGKPPVFISHGTIDNVLPIDECSRRIVPRLKQEGYLVTYREFEGKHTLPPEVASEAMQWFMDLRG